MLGLINPLCLGSVPWTYSARSTILKKAEKNGKISSTGLLCFVSQRAQYFLQDALPTPKSEYVFPRSIMLALLCHIAGHLRLRRLWTAF